jgi:hypothetical protein
VLNLFNCACTIKFICRNAMWINNYNKKKSQQFTNPLNQCGNYDQVHL